MSTSRKIVRIFLGSPGDLAEERRLAKAVVDEFNDLWADRLGYQVELVGWEDTVSRFGRPQATINEELAQCEFFVGLMWRRWGTPPSVSGPYTSGFEEEFRTAVAGHEATGRPEISLYFKNIDRELLRDPGDELKKVIAFKHEIVEQKKLLFETFDNLEDFRERFSRCVTRYIQRLSASEAAIQKDETQAPTKDTSSTSASPKLPESSPLSAKGAQFLRTFIDKTEGDLTEVPISATEVARFRLLGTVVEVAGNDSRPLGPHDANLLFSARKSTSFGKTEIRALISSGLANLRSENVPLWYWVVEAEATTNKLLFNLTLNGSEQKRAGAFLALKLLRRPFSFEQDDGRELQEAFASMWLKAEPADLRVAALDYMGTCAGVEMLPKVRAELENGSYQTKGAAIEAALRIAIRDEPRSAIELLLEMQPETLKPDLLKELSDALSHSPILRVKEATAHKSPDIRVAAMRILRERGIVDVVIAERLTEDAVANVRYEAFLMLESGGRRFSEREARAILIKPQGSGLAIFQLGNADEQGEKNFGFVRARRLELATTGELEEAGPDLLYARDEMFALIKRELPDREAWLQSAIRDGFEQAFSDAVETLTQSDSDPSRTRVGQFTSAEVSIRKDLTRRALNLLYLKGEPGADEIGLVRSSLANDFVDYANEDIEFLRKHGDSTDIELIVSAIDRSDDSAMFMLRTHRELKYQIAAHAIYSLGRDNVGSLLNLKLSTSLLVQLIGIIPSSVFRTVEDHHLLTLLGSPTAVVRKVTAAQCVRALPKKRISLLLETVLGQPRRYYNVVHWLDMGASLPKEESQSIAAGALQAETRE